RFIDDQQAAPAAARLFMEEALDGSERARLIMPFDVEAEALGDDMDDLFFIELAGHDLANRDLPRVDGAGEVRHQRRFAGSHLAGDDDEALSLREAVTEVRQRLAVGDAAEIERRIGRQLEGLSGKAVEVVEHDVVSGGPS